jgi:molybdenum cofactor cytidylyltransferase
MAADARIAGVVLAAGLSSRMRRNKLLLDIGGESLVRRAVRTALAAALDPVLVIVGHEEERVRAELDGLRCTAVRNPDYARGMNTSLRAGIAAVPAGAAGAVVLLGDMPFVTAEMVGALVARFRSGGAPLAISVYAGVVAPPTLYGSALFAEIAALEGDGCGKKIVKQHRSEAIELPWPASALADVDVPADVERVRAAGSGR